MKLCQIIISDTETLLSDDRLLDLSTAHRQLLREKLRKAIIQVRTIQQEALAHDSSRLANQVANANPVLHLFNQRVRPSGLLSLLDNKEKPD